MEIDDLEDYEMKPRGLVGLTNIGNTCYMNSALQSLSNCPPLTRFFLQSEEFGVLPPDTGKLMVSRCYRDLISKMWDRKRPKQLTPSLLMRAIRSHHPIFKGYAQQDTQEFLRCLMDSLHEELKREVYVYSDDDGDSDDSMMEMEVDEEPPNTLLHKHRRKRTSSSVHRSRSKSQSYSPRKEKIVKSIITNVFDGKLLSCVQCLTCNRLSSTIETFQDLSLPIPTKDDLSHMHSQVVLSCSPHLYTDTGWFSYLWDWMKSWVIGPDIRLQDCLAAFFTNDELKGDNMYNCEKCKKLRNGLKYSRVNNLPEVLCIHLKRFRHELYYSSKISTFISFPLHDLDLNPFLSKDCAKQKSSSKYDLTAIICHFGSVGGGHYISYAKNCVNNKWYEFNDSFVTEVSEATVMNAEAYVLFYSLKDENATLFRKEINHKLKSTKINSDIQYISREWLNRFDSSIQPGPISNFDVICKHGGINLQSYEKINTLVTSIPKSIYKLLLQRFGGGPELTSLSVCRTCQEISKKKEYELDTFTKLHEEFRNACDTNLPTYQITMKWYNSWYAYVTKKTEVHPGEIDNSDLYASDCSQSNDKEDTSYGLISESTWKFLHLHYGGGPAVMVHKSAANANDEELSDIEDIIPASL